MDAVVGAAFEAAMQVPAGLRFLFARRRDYSCSDNLLSSALGFSSNKLLSSG